MTFRFSESNEALSAPQARNQCAIGAQASINSI
jgi:hypothetical protein